MARSPADMEGIPRLGWVRDPTPITRLDRLGEELGVDFLGVKRDDLLEPLHGGTKARKLDYLLAAPPFADAPAWAALGAIGSGNLVALTAAAAKLDRRLEAYVFWTMLSPGVVDNLAFTASGPTTLHYFGSRGLLAVRAPALFFADRIEGVPVLPHGATSPVGALGMVRAGLELGEQVRAGELPEPDRVYLAFGSGGTAVGLAAGLALAGLGTTVIGVTVVEHALSIGRVAVLERELAVELQARGLGAPKLRIELERGQVGAGYAIPTEASIAACEKLAGEGLSLDPIYTGKAMAALLAGAKKSGARRVLFWQTRRRGPIPHAAEWRSRLPPALAARIAEAEAAAGKPKPRLTRRRLILAASAAFAALGVGQRLSGYPLIEGFSGAVLATWEAHVVRRAAEVLLPPGLDDAALTSVAVHVDRYLVGMPPAILRDIHGMIALVEHGTPLGGRTDRFTHLDPTARAAFLASLEARGGLLAQAYRGLRDLVLLGHYQRPSTWADLGYEGPRIPLGYDPRGPGRMSWPTYDALVAPEGSLPAGIVR